MSNYYVHNLNSTKLFQVYQTKYPRVERYFDEEINFVRRNLHGGENVLEVGAGYGRIMKELAQFAACIVGIDISAESVEFGKDYIKECRNCSIQVMDAHNLEFGEEFDVVMCLQNGLSAMKGQPMHLIRQCMKVLVPGGKAYFSTYSDKFWEHRLAWFYEQADKGLLGEIDTEKTQNGIIVCKDGFTAITFSEDALRKLGEESGYPYSIEEVDESSLFLILEK
ncbi:class I SAM-dependent methyltransferase [Lutispora sp.]|uniref:class I SAM-dependent methyltransferase n=1 Tax=Lutispora sp. TaxID=2828727 RepID=UPI002B21DEE2|nr:class I SAM-dependent methyltransferase [Lutispora sp.]MEA4961427.1 class I SAM-dependent methyltransferase [Lutispora sp.]